MCILWIFIFILITEFTKRVYWYAAFLFVLFWGGVVFVLFRFSLFVFCNIALLIVLLA